MEKKKFLNPNIIIIESDYSEILTTSMGELTGQVNRDFNSIFGEDPEP